MWLNICVCTPWWLIPYILIFCTFVVMTLFWFPWCQFTKMCHDVTIEFSFLSIQHPPKAILLRKQSHASVFNSLARSRAYPRKTGDKVGMGHKFNSGYYTHKHIFIPISSSNSTYRYVLGGGRKSENLTSGSPTNPGFRVDPDLRFSSLWICGPETLTASPLHSGFNSK